YYTNEYPNPQNPQKPLIFLLPAPAHRDVAVSAEEARLFCDSQEGARLPYAAELLTASAMGKDYPGGIPTLEAPSYYFVSDQNYHATEYYLTTGDTDPINRLRAKVSYNKGFYYCVKGPVSAKIQYQQKLWKIIRYVRGVPGIAVYSDPRLAALECLLEKSGDLGYRVIIKPCQSFPEDEQVIKDYLQREGVEV
ncbi:MAG: hypothetical protein WCG27_13615, partial [Pseudomonadota bacterium]